MRPTTDAERLGAFVDGELELAAHLEIEAQAATDDALRARIDELRRVREIMRDGATYHPAPAALRARIERLAQEDAAPSATPAPRRIEPRAATPFGALARWLAWRPMLAAAAVVGVLAIALNLEWLRMADQRRLLDDVVASHVRATLGQRLVDMASSDHHTVKPWLSTHLDYSPPVVEPTLPGSTLVGGRVDYLEGRPVAALVYRQGQHVVTSFVWPASDGAEREPAYARERGFETAHWVQSGMEHWLVSDLNAEEFHTLVAALRQGEGKR
jgi:anti-sigma factor RsiW